MQSRWPDCPAHTQAQVADLVAALDGLLTERLLGIYLHGSLALGCFHPATSDVDMLVVMPEELSLDTRKRVVELLLTRSGAPHPVEISFLRHSDLTPWRHPCPFDMHYSETWRRRYQEGLANGSWVAWAPTTAGDDDLAAHITVTRARGICLTGLPIEQVFPPIPPEHYADSIVGDFYWMAERLLENPAYLVLNACRVLAFLTEDMIASKDEGGVWGLKHLPTGLRPLVSAALTQYRNGEAGRPLDEAALRLFVRDMSARIEAAAAVRGLHLPYASGHTAGAAHGD